MVRQTAVHPRAVQEHQGHVALASVEVDRRKRFYHRHGRARPWGCSVLMDGAPDSPADVFDRLLDVWSRGDPAAIVNLITVDYVGHMLHLEHGQRSAQDYPGWIQAFRDTNPGTRFEI